GGQVAGFLAEHPTAVKGITAGVIGGYEAGKAAYKYKVLEEPLSEVVGEAAVNIGRMAGFASTVGKGYRAGRKGVRSVKDFLETPKAQKFLKDTGFRQLAKEEAGTAPRQQARTYGGYGSEQALKEAAAQGDVRAQEILRNMIESGELTIEITDVITPTSGEVSEAGALALKRFQETTKIGLALGPKAVPTIYEMIGQPLKQVSKEEVEEALKP
ncbi:hypothetical protein AKJ38_02300, partial [candidate division MSBL1 archaeon SCGC-AAA259I14]